MSRRVIDWHPVVQRRKVIIYVGGFDLPDNNAAAQRVVANARLAALVGFTPVLLGVSHRSDAPRTLTRSDHQGLEFESWTRRYPLRPIEWAQRIFCVSDIVRVINEHYANDLAGIICYDFPAIAQIRMQKFARRHNVPAVAEITEWYSPKLSMSLPAIARAIDSPLRMRFANYKMDGLIVSSPFLKNYYQDTNLPCLFLPTLISDQKNECTDPCFEQGDYVPTLFFAGSGYNKMTIKNSKDGPKERLDLIILALYFIYKNNNKFKINIYGVSFDEYIEVNPSHKRILSSMADFVIFHGRQSRADVINSIKKSHYAIMLRDDNRTSRVGFPTKYAEAIYHGTPMITNDLQTLADYNRDGRYGFVVPMDNVEALSASLSDILSLPLQARMTLSQNCFDDDPFSPKAFFKSAQVFYQQLCRSDKKC